MASLKTGWGWAAGRTLLEISTQFSLSFFSSGQMEIWLLSVPLEVLGSDGLHERVCGGDS